nr:hypothetical protein [Tanacetum cinerariifolium]
MLYLMIPHVIFNNDVSFEEELVHQRLRKTLTHVLELSSCIYLDDRAWEVLNFDSAGMRTFVTGFPAQSNSSSNTIALDSPYLLVLNTGASQSRQHGRHKDKVGMKIPDWMISEAMKQTKHCQMYVEVFTIDVPLTQSHPTESTQGMHRTPSAPRSIRLTPPAPVLTVDKADELILQDTLQMVEGQENVADDRLIPRNDKHYILGTRLEPMSDKESPEVGITDVVVPVNFYDEEEEEDEITDESYLSGHILHVHPAQPQTTSVSEQQYQLYLLMKDDPQWQKQVITIWLALQMKFKRLQVPQTTCRTHVVHPKDQDDPHDDAHPKGENSNQEQVDGYDFWTDSYALDDDKIPSKQVSQYIMEEMTNFLKSDIVWENQKEILVSPHPRKTTPLVLSCQRDPEAPALSLINQDLLYLKRGNSRPEKIVLSLHKFPANPHAKIFYIRKQKEPGKPKEVIYSNSKIIQVIKTYWELGHEHKFITEIIARRANECIVSITELDFKNLNKNDIEDMYLLIMNGKHEMFSIIYEPVHGIIYKNNKKEKRVMRHSAIHKFCDATLNRVLEGLKSYNNDVRYNYNQRDLTKDKVEYLKLFEEDIKDRLKYRRQMRSWESYVNGRPLGLKRECPK